MTHIHWFPETSRKSPRDVHFDTVDGICPVLAEFPTMQMFVGPSCLDLSIGVEHGYAPRM